MLMDKDVRVFVDGMTSVRVVEGVVRMEFFNNDEEGNPARCGELVMSQQAFLRTYGAMEDLIRQLTEAGIVKRRSAAEIAEDKNASPASKPAASPNFQ